MDTAAFVRTVLIGEVQQMHRVDVRMNTLAAISHGIEVAGALLDDRPFRAKGLGRSRFGLALRKLYPKKYAVADTQVDMYGQLRSHLSHSLLPGGLICLDDGMPHLHFDGERLHINIGSLVDDHVLAMRQLLTMEESGVLKSKRILG